MSARPRKSPSSDAVGARGTGSLAPEVHRRVLVPAVLLFALGVLVSGMAFLGVRARDAALRRTTFEKEAAQVAVALRDGFDRPLEVLFALPPFFESSTDVSRAEFQTFVRGFLERHEGIYALEWIPWVPHAEREALEERARKDGLADFTFTQLTVDGEIEPADPRPEYFPIYYMAPPNPTAVGFDVASEPDRRAPLDRAIEYGRTVSTPRLQLVEDPPEVASVAVFQPVYRDPASAGTKRREAATGVACVVFRIGPVVEAALARADTTRVDFVLYDASGEVGSMILHQTVAGLTPAETRDDRFHFRTGFTFADRAWGLLFRVKPAYRVSPLAGTGTLALGLTISALLAGALYGTGRVLQLRRQVEAALRLGQYTLGDRIGQGGMGTVYKAEHALLKRPTAVKLLRPDQVGERSLARFEKEVQLTSRLSHPNTVSVFDYGRTRSGIFYYAMEYLSGITLQQLVETEGPQPAGRVVRILDQVCGALAEAHSRGVVHRDIKPANLMLGCQGGIPDFVKVLDFGLVKETYSAEGATDVSVTGSLIGTPHYISPEGITNPSKVNHRSDLYALGAVGYFLLTGGEVFEGDNVVEICTRHIGTAPPPPSARTENEIPASLDAVILKCLEKKPERRFGSAVALRDALRGCTDVVPWTEDQARAWWERRGVAFPS